MRIVAFMRYCLKVLCSICENCYNKDGVDPQSLNWEYQCEGKSKTGLAKNTAWGSIGELTQKLYDELTGIQLSKREDKFGWVSKVC